MTVFTIKPQKDLPVNDAKLLGIDRVVETLINFLHSDNLIAPLSIAIHGDWGSGKTSLLKTLETRVDNRKIRVIFFEAWKYEYTNPAVALVTKITSELADNTDAAVGVITMCVDILSRHYLNMEAKDMLAYFRKTSDSVTNFSDTIKKVISNKLEGKKLVVLIDDLDRCDVENALLILTMMKLFLDQDNCICIAAVDLKRLEQAWHQKYGVNIESSNEGKSYLEKIFQIRVGMPHPTNSQIEVYIDSLAPGMSSAMLKVMSKIGPTNPRSIKRMFNLISYRSHIINSDNGAEVAALWTLLEEAISQKYAVQLYQTMEQLGGGFVGQIINEGHDWKNISDHIGSRSPILIEIKHNEELRIFFKDSKDILNSIKSKSNLGDDFLALYIASNEFLRR